MNIYIGLIFIIYIIAMMITPHKTFLSYVLFKPLINKNFAVFSQPGLPLLSLDMAICLFTLFYFLAKRRDEMRSFKSYPLIIPFGFYLLSMLLSSVFSTLPFAQSLIKTISYINDDWLFIFLFWMIIVSKEDLYLIIRFYVVIFSIMCIYGFLEQVLDYNPVMQFESLWIQDPLKITTFSYDLGNRLGMGRVQSLTIHAITYGALLAIIMATYSLIVIHYKEKKTNYAILLLVLLLFIINIFLTNSRAPLVLLIIASIGVFNFNKAAFIRFWVPLILVISISYLANFEFITKYSENLLSLQNVQDSSVGGSDLRMRLTQYATTFDVFQNHKILGLGIGSLQEILWQDVGIFGAESVWIGILIEQGLFGVFCHLVLIFYLYKNFHIKGNYIINKFFIFIITAWLVFSFSTGEMWTRNLFLTSILIIYQLFNPTGSVDQVEENNLKNNVEPA